MRAWHTLPFLKVLIPFITGICIAIHIRAHWGFFLAFILIGNLALILLERRTNAKWVAFPYRKAGVVVMLCLLCLGFFRVATFRDIERPSHFSRFQASAHKLNVKEFKSTKYGFHQFEAEVKEVKLEDNLYRTLGNIIVYWDTSLSYLPGIGDQFWVKANFKKIPPPKNPGEFDYQKYLSDCNIHFKIYIRSEKSFVFAGKESLPMTNLLETIRSWVRSVFKEHLSSGKSLQMARALILGQRGELNNQTKSYFSQTGTLHVLAVSGLHVGIVFLVLQSLMRFIKRMVGVKAIEVLLVLIGIWLYALIAGFSPSVQRASCMFTLLHLGNLFKGRYSAVNSLCASAFIMLAYNPYLITNVGFQLSYAAVLGILLIYKPLYALVHFSFIKSRIVWIVMDKIWAVCVVSLSAQIATLPISLHYFGQLPTYFLVANLLVIPAVFALVCLAVLMIVLSPLSFLAKGVALVFKWVTNGTLLWVKFVAQLPYSHIPGLYVSFAEVIVLFLAMGFGVKWLYSRRIFHLNVFLLFMAVFLGGVNIKYISSANETKIWVHSVRGNQVISYIHGNNAIVITDSAFLESPDAQKFYLTPYLRENYVRKTHFFTMSHELAAVKMEPSEIHLFEFESQFPNFQGLKKKDENLVWLLKRNSYTDTAFARYKGTVIWTQESSYLRDKVTRFPCLDSFAVDIAM